MNTSNYFNVRKGGESKYKNDIKKLGGVNYFPKISIWVA